MSGKHEKPEPHFGKISTVQELGQILRDYRRHQNQTIEKVAGLSNLSAKFLSELERGKETAELGKTLLALQRVGLEVSIQPRGYQSIKLKDHTSDK